MKMMLSILLYAAGVALIILGCHVGSAKSEVAPAGETQAPKKDPDPVDGQLRLVKKNGHFEIQRYCTYPDWRMLGQYESEARARETFNALQETLKPEVIEVVPSGSN